MIENLLDRKEILLKAEKMIAKWYICLLRFVELFINSEPLQTGVQKYVFGFQHHFFKQKMLQKCVIQNYRFFEFLSITPSHFF